MATVTINDLYLEGIGNAIRYKNGTTETYRPSEMAAAIRALGSAENSYDANDYIGNNLTLRIRADQTSYTNNFNGEQNSTLLPLINWVEVEKGSVLTYLAPGLAYNNNLKRVDLSNATALTSIGSAHSSFADDQTYYSSAMLVNDTALEEVILPPNAEHIGMMMCSDCEALKKVTFPDVPYLWIHNKAFYNCGFTDLDIPYTWNLWLGHSNSTTYKPLELPEDGFTFGYNSNLKTVTIHAKKAIIHPTTFMGCHNVTDIYVPWNEGAVDYAPWGAAYATVHYNSEGPNTTRLIIGDSVTSIEANRYEGNLNEVIFIPESVTSIGSRAFADCPNLKAVYIYNPSNITIARDAFEGCHAYRFYINGGLGHSAFSTCPWGNVAPEGVGQIDYVNMKGEA